MSREEHPGSDEVGEGAEDRWIPDESGTDASKRAAAAVGGLQLECGLRNVVWGVRVEVSHGGLLSSLRFAVRSQPEHAPQLLVAARATAAEAGPRLAQQPAWRLRQPVRILLTDPPPVYGDHRREVEVWSNVACLIGVGQCASIVLGV